MDVAIIKDYVYLSASMSSNQIVEKTYEKNKTERTCQFLQVFRAKFNEEELKFKNILNQRFVFKISKGAEFMSINLITKKFNFSKKRSQKLRRCCRRTKDNSILEKFIFSLITLIIKIVRMKLSNYQILKDF